MKNVKCKVEGSKLLVEIDLDQRLGESGSGKSVTVATTGGNVEVPGFPAIKLGINCYTAK